MKILLLGRRGFVGQNLFDHLAASNDYEIIAPAHSELDVLDERSVFDCLKLGAFDVVLNCLDAHGETNAEYGETRLRMYHNLANHSDLFGKMVYFGSGAEYGRQLPIVNVAENDFGRVVPDDTYGFALYQMSLHAMASDNIYNLRLFGIFGPHELWRRRFISNFICRGLLNVPLIMRQDRIMDYLYIDDLAKMVQWVMASTPKHHDYNATSGRGVALKEIAREIQEQLNLSGEELYCAYEGMGSEYTSANNRITGEMDDLEIMTMSTSIAKLIQYYRDNIDDIDFGDLALS